MLELFNVSNVSLASSMFATSFKHRMLAMDFFLKCTVSGNRFKSSIDV